MKINHWIGGLLFAVPYLLSAMPAVAQGTSFIFDSGLPDKGIEHFRKINPKELKDNPVSLFADNWFVVSAGNSSKNNEMTISWGNIGNVWDEPSVTIYIRNTRYTYPIIDKGRFFVLNSFPEQYRDKVKFIGTHTGRTTDKVKATGLTLRFTPLGNPYFDEAKLVIECEKIYSDDIDRTRLFEKGRQMYSGDTNETHRMFIGRIVNMWIKE